MEMRLGTPRASFDWTEGESISGIPVEPDKQRTSSFLQQKMHEKFPASAMPNTKSMLVPPAVLQLSAQAILAGAPSRASPHFLPAWSETTSQLQAERN